jgi:hypothetical protein
LRQLSQESLHAVYNLSRVLLGKNGDERFGNLQQGGAKVFVRLFGQAAELGTRLLPPKPGPLDEGRRGVPLARREIMVS